MKKLFIALIILLSVETWAAISVNRALRPADPRQISKRDASKVFDNPTGRTILASRIPNLIKIRAGDKINTQTDSRAWLSSSTQLFQPSTNSGLVNFFYHSSGTRNPWAAYQETDATKGMTLDGPTLGVFLLQLAEQVGQPAQNAELVIENGRAVKFAPDLPGLTLDLASSKYLLEYALPNSVAPELSLPVRRTEPALRLADLNSQGIKELIGTGQSDFTGSTASRITNIKVGASRYDGLIIPSGSEFSFNKYLGPIDAKAGFLPELVIKSDGTKPEFGGGLCQVSTTAFRAAFFSGLPILERHNHSYAVHYYEWISDSLPKSVGLDATIYPGSADMKFVNDTPGAILIQTQISGKRLTFNFYGTSDNRQVAIDGPYTFDKKPSGAVKSKVTRTVTKNGITATDEFLSNYVSPLLFPKVYEYPPQPQPNATAPDSPNPTTPPSTQPPVLPPNTSTDQPPIINTPNP